jgi:hypothetical protein
LMYFIPLLGNSHTAFMFTNLRDLILSIWPVWLISRGWFLLQCIGPLHWNVWRSIFTQIYFLFYLDDYELLLSFIIPKYLPREKCAQLQLCFYWVEQTPRMLLTLVSREWLKWLIRVKSIAIKGSIIRTIMYY